jgi:polysaccharide biosynthesis protein PelF
MTMGTSVLLATEGTFPFHRGGVSTWCDVLTRQLPEIDFSLLAVTMHPYLKSCYTLAPNVRQLLTVPLWGTEQPEEHAWHVPLTAFFQRRWATTDELVAKRFVPTFARFLTQLLASDQDVVAIADDLVAMHRYFQTYDYDRTMKASSVWRCVQHAVRASRPGWPHDFNPSVADLSEALRLLARLLSVIYYPVPRTDLGHATAASFCGLPCVIAKLEHGTPYLLTEHGVYLREQYLSLRKHIPSFFVRWFLYRLIQAVVRVNYRHADQVLPVCAYNMRWERWWGVPTDRLRVIFNGVDPARYCPEEVRAPRARPLILGVGLIYALKGQLDLIEAVALARKTTPAIECKVYGSVSDQRYYAACQELITARGLENHVTFSGLAKEPWRIYPQADLLVSASISEGLPYVLIEAMLSALPIVATDVGGVGEVIGDAGILVRPHHPEELAQGIVKLVSDPLLRRRLGQRARARGLRFFTQQQFLREYRDVYACLAPQTAGDDQRIPLGPMATADARADQYVSAYQ